MQGLGYQFLAGTGWPFDQHRGRTRSHQADAAADFKYAGGVANQLRQPLAGGQLGGGNHMREAGLRMDRGGGDPRRRNYGRGCGRKGRNRPRMAAHRIERRVRFVERGRRVPDRRVVVLRAPERIQQFLAVGSARALLRNRTVGGHQIHIGELGAEVLEEFSQVEIGKPRVDDHRLGQGRPRLRPGLSAAFSLPHLPAQAGKSLGEPLTEVAVGAGHQRGAWADAAGQRKGGNGNCACHEDSPESRSS